jgi:hypothetical protein
MAAFLTLLYACVFLLLAAFFTGVLRPPAP